MCVCIYFLQDIVCRHSPSISSSLHPCLSYFLGIPLSVSVLPSFISLFLSIRQSFPSFLSFPSFRSFRSFLSVPSFFSFLPFLPVLPSFLPSFLSSLLLLPSVRPSFLFYTGVTPRALHHIFESIDKQAQRDWTWKVKEGRKEREGRKEGT